MYKLKFRDLSIVSNKKLNCKKNKSQKILVIIPGLGCVSKDYAPFLTSLNKIHIILFKNPGHEGVVCNLRNDYLLDYVKKIYCFLKIKGIDKFNIFCHSMSSIIFILLYKNFLRNKNKNCKFLIFEGNLIGTDSSLVTKKTISYPLKFFTEVGFNNLLKKCTFSEDYFIRNWSKNIKNISAFDFYMYSKHIYNWSKKDYLLGYFKNYFKNTLYLYGEKSANRNLISKLCGHKKKCIKNGNHFAYIYDKDIFTTIIHSFI